MKASRRDCLKIGALASLGAVLPGCTLVARQVSQRNPSRLQAPVTADERLLNRIGFGASEESLAHLQEVGARAYVEGQLGAAIDEELSLLLQLQRLDVLQLEASELWDLPGDRVFSQLQQAAILRAVYGKNQLRERMADFWSNHFNIYARKGNTVYSKGVEENRIVREHALGRFADMLSGIAKSPAMLEFLDNQKNAKGVANENYARELMELHTLGIHGGYTQHDVQEVARCFTGWTIEDRFLHAKGTFRFDPDRHDDGAKEVLGEKIAHGGGIADGEQVLALLAKHPSTARFLAQKLCIHFLGEAPPPWVERLAIAYLANGTDIRSTLEALLKSQDLTSAGPILKRPFDYMVSSLRATGAETDGGADLQKHLERMGEPLYQWPMPDGYPERPSSWTSGLLPRWNFALALARGEIAGTSVQVPDPQEAALALAHPDFQYR